MGKMSDMAMTIEKLRSAAAAINDATDWLAEQFGNTESAEVAPRQPLDLRALQGGAAQVGGRGAEARRQPRLRRRRELHMRRMVRLLQGEERLRRADANLELVKYDFKLPSLLTGEDVEDIFGKVDDLVSRASDIKDYVLQQAISGKV